jgi:CheY-like chemotaxis protein
MKILIVDDDEMNIEILVDILEDAGFETTYAENGQEALGVLESDAAGKIKLILLDRMMPVMDGMEFKEAISLDDRWKDIPIIFQTAASQPKDLVEGMQTGAYYYLTKPFDKEILLSIVHAAMKDNGLE